MKFDEYTEAAKLTAIYPQDVAIDYLIHGLVSETGEVADKRKKQLRGDGVEDSEIIAELGDVLWYLTLLASEFGVSTTTIAQYNLEKLADRANRGKLQGKGDIR